ncbi:hypothetical protein DM02DRAFT_676200, partial [Periconia macrospinosa]
LRSQGRGNAGILISFTPNFVAVNERTPRHHSTAFAYPADALFISRGSWRQGQHSTAPIQGAGHRADRQGSSRRQSKQGDQNSAGPAQDESTATQGCQAAGAERGAAGRGLCVAGVVPDRDARHEEAFAAVAKDHGTGGHPRI